MNLIEESVRNKEQQKKKTTTTIILVMIILLAIAIIGIAGYLFLCTINNITSAYRWTIK